MLVVPAQLLLRVLCLCCTQLEHSSGIDASANLPPMLRLQAAAYTCHLARLLRCAQTCARTLTAHPNAPRWLLTSSSLRVYTGMQALGLDPLDQEKRCVYWYHVPALAEEDGGER